MVGSCQVGGEGDDVAVIVERVVVVEDEPVTQVAMIFSSFPNRFMPTRCLVDAENHMSPLSSNSSRCER